MNHQHVFIKGSLENAPTLLLLHGTGGNERDLLQLADMIAPGASILGVRGNVLENGMPRFFRRLAEGVFDEEDLLKRTKELHQFVSEMAVQYKFDRDRVLAVGYSNGANIAASLLYHEPKSLHGAILLHAMVPRRGVEIPDLTDVSVFLGAGKYDPIVPVDLTSELSNDLQKANASVTEYWTEAGHQITHEEVKQAKQWYENLYSA